MSTRRPSRRQWKDENWKQAHYISGLNNKWNHWQRWHFVIAEVVVTSYLIKKHIIKMTEWTREFPTEPSVVLCCWHSQPVATTHNEAPPMIAGTNVWKCRRYINQNSKHSTCVSLLHTTAVWPKWMCSMISSFAAQCQPVHFNWVSAHFIDTPHIYMPLAS